MCAFFFFFFRFCLVFVRARVGPALERGNVNEQLYQTQKYIKCFILNGFQGALFICGSPSFLCRGFALCLRMLEMRAQTSLSHYCKRNAHCIPCRKIDCFKFFSSTICFCVAALLVCIWHRATSPWQHHQQSDNAVKPYTAAELTLLNVFYKQLIAFNIHLFLVSIESNALISISTGCCRNSGVNVLEEMSVQPFAPWAPSAVIKQLSCTHTLTNILYYGKGLIEYSFQEIKW